MAAGDFDTLHLRHRETNSVSSEVRVIDDWLAEGVGLVRRTIGLESDAPPYATMELVSSDTPR